MKKNTKFSRPVVKGKRYAFHEIPLEVSRAIVTTWKQEGNDEVDLLQWGWEWEGGNSWVAVK